MPKLLLFLLFPAIELYLLVKIGGIIGAMNMVFWVFGSAFLGFWVMRSKGTDAMNRVRTDLSQGKMPQNPFVENLLMFVAGILLILPGLITDTLGLLLLLPPARQWLIATFSRKIAEQQAKGGSSRIIFFSSGPDGVHRRGFDETPDFGDFGAGSGAGQSQPRQATIIDSTPIDVEATEVHDETGASGDDRQKRSSGE